MNNKPVARTTIHPAGEASRRLDVLYQRGKEPVALVAAAELTDWLETAAYPGKYLDDETAGDAEHDRLAGLLGGLQADYFLLRVLEASETAAAGGGMSLDIEQLRAMGISANVNVAINGRTRSSGQLGR